MRRLATLLMAIALGATVLATAATGDDTRTYKVELDNAFGMTDGSEVKVSGVVVGTVTELDINAAKRALLEIELSGDLSQLGEDTICTSSPQSLIAEYSLDCAPKGPPLEDGGTIPVEQTRQTVQNDLVQNTMREPYKERFRLILNEFGTAIAGNSKSLNQAIRRGAPALREARKVLKILGDQNTLLRDLNVNSDQIFVRLAEQRGEVRRFLTEAADISQATAERKEDLSEDFRLLDDFIAELDPTLVSLGEVTAEQTPLLRDLRASAAGLNTLATRIPAFNQATGRSLNALGDAAEVGERAFGKGANELDALRRATRNAFPAADDLANFFKDIDDPNRAVEVDRRAHEDTGRPEPTGYTGLEGLLNYVYYQTGAINQFDQVSHLLHFSLFDVESHPCAGFNTGGDPEGEEFGVPAQDGGTTTNLLEAHRCVGWLGPNQPGINTGPELEPYDPSVCPDGSEAPALCDPDGGGGLAAAAQSSPTTEIAPEVAAPATPDPGGGKGNKKNGAGDGGDAPALNGALEGLLDLPGDVLGTGKGSSGGQRGSDDGDGPLGLFSNSKQSAGGARGLLDFLFGA